MSKGCKAIGDSTKDRKVYVKNELNIRKKALELPIFPDEDLISEYLINNESVYNFNVDWKQPNIVKFIVSTVLAFPNYHVIFCIDIF